MNAIVQSLKTLGPTRQMAIIGVLVAFFAFFGFITTRVASPPMALLYGQLDTSDAGAIGAELEKLQIPFETNTAGTEIRVPSDQVGRIRMSMAQQGLPKGGSIGYEIFDRQEGFGTTSFVQNINHLRALEGELARTIGTLAGVSSARVHLVLPRRELFSKTEQSATASIFLKLRSSLSREQISSIQQLVAASVPDLQPNKISIIDDRGNLLARAATEGAEAMGGGSRDEMRAGYERSLAQKIEELLGRSIGYGKVRAQVTADLDFDRITTTSEIYDPDSAVVRSTQTMNEQSANTEGGANAGVSVTNNLPAAAAAPSGGSTTNNNQNRTEETINYEINRTTRSQVREAGSVRRLSVAVVVDGITTTAADGAQSYAPRSNEEMDQIRSLVRSAVNFDATRGDTLEVVNMRFSDSSAAATTEGTAPEELMGFQKSDLLRLGETLILVLVGVLVLFLIVKPMLTRLMDTAQAGGGDGLDLIGGPGGGPAQLAAPGGATARQISAEAAAAESAVEQMIDISRVDGRVKASAIRKVGEIIDKHPEEAVSIIRNWLYQDQRG